MAVVLMVHAFHRLAVVHAFHRLAVVHTFRRLFRRLFVVRAFHRAAVAHLVLFTQGRRSLLCPYFLCFVRETDGADGDQDGHD